MSKALELSVSRLTKAYAMGRTRIGVLREMEAVFPAGAVTTIQGASGSGKSTLLNVLGGLEAPEAGEVLWGNRSIYDWAGAQLAEWRQNAVGFVFQSYHLLPELAAWENVDLPAHIARRSSEMAARELLARVGLKDRADHRPAELSGGEQQRVAIARALRNDPALLLADEPTGNLDAVTGREIIDLLLALQREKQKTLVIVTHDTAVAALGKCRLRLAEGKLTVAD